MALCRIGVWLQRPPAVERGFQVQQSAVQPGAGDRWRQVTDQRGARASLGDHAFGRIIGGVQVEIGQVLDETVRPTLGGHAGLFARHEFQRAMRAEMQHGIGTETLSDPAIEGTKGMGGGKSALKQHAHRITFIAKAGLQADEHVAELRAEHENRTSVGQLLAGCRPPLALDFRQPGLMTHVVVGGNARHDIGVGAEPFRIAFQHDGAERGFGFRHLHRVALGLHAAQSVEQGSKDPEIGGRAGGAAVRREIEQDDGDAAFGTGRTAQCHQFRHARGEHPRAFEMRHHIAGAVCSVAAFAAVLGAGHAAAATECHRQDAAIQLRYRHHHRGFHRQQAAGIGTPLCQCLEFEGMSGDIGHVQPRQGCLGRTGIVIGGAADEGKTGQ